MGKVCPSRRAGRAGRAGPRGCSVRARPRGRLLSDAAADAGGARCWPPGAGGGSVGRLALTLGCGMGGECSWLPGKVAEPRCAASPSAPTLLSWPLPGALAAQGGRGVQRPARAPISCASGRALRSAPALCAEPGVPTSFGGTPRRLFFNCPTATHLPQVGGWRLLLTLPLPRPLPLPHHTPTPRRGHATGRSLASALPGAAPFPTRAGPGRAGGGAPGGCGNPRQGSLEAARRRTEPPARDRGSALGRQCPGRLVRARVGGRGREKGKGWRQKFAAVTPARPEMNPQEGEECALFSEQERFIPFSRG